MLILRCSRPVVPDQKHRTGEDQEGQLAAQGREVPGDVQPSSSLGEPVCAQCGETCWRRSCFGFPTYAVYFKGPPGKHRNETLRREEHFSPLLTLIVFMILPHGASFTIIHVQMRRLKSKLKQPEY